MTFYKQSATTACFLICTIMCLSGCSVPNNPETSNSISFSANTSQQKVPKSVLDTFPKDADIEGKVLAQSELTSDKTFYAAVIGYQFTKTGWKTVLETSAPMDFNTLSIIWLESDSSQHLLKVLTSFQNKESQCSGSTVDQTDLQLLPGMVIRTYASKTISQDKTVIATIAEKNIEISDFSDYDRVFQQLKQEGTIIFTLQIQESKENSEEIPLSKD